MLQEAWSRWDSSHKHGICSDSVHFWQIGKDAGEGITARVEAVSSAICLICAFYSREWPLLAMTGAYSAREFSKFNFKSCSYLYRLFPIKELIQSYYAPIFFWRIQIVGVRNVAVTLIKLMDIAVVGLTHSRASPLSKPLSRLKVCKEILRMVGAGEVFLGRSVHFWRLLRKWATFSL